MTIVERYREKLAKMRDGLRERHERVWNAATAKERLNILVESDFLTPLQRRRLAGRMDSLVKTEGTAPDDAFDIALEEFETGELKVEAKDPKAKQNLLTLAQLRENRPDLGQKQELLELREAGSITPDQTKRAARYVTQGQTIEQALFHVDADHLLNTVPAGVEDEEPEEEAEEEAEEEVEEGDEDEDEPQSEPAPRSSEEVQDDGGPKTIGGVLDEPIRDILHDHLPKIRHKPAALELIVKEVHGKTRKTLIPELVNHALSLGATESEIQEALDIASGGLAEDTYAAAMGVVEDWKEDEG